MVDSIAPIHPGEILKTEFMAPHKLSANKLARKLGLPPSCITEIICGRHRITAQTALRLSRIFGSPPKFWTNLQTLYDLEIVKKNGA